MEYLRFGTAGIPLSTPRPGTAEGVKRVKALGLGCMELEFVRNVNLNEEKARAVREAARKLDIRLSVHGPYYINLNSNDPEITKASINRILKSSRIGFLAGAVSLTFHAGYYLKQEKSRVYEKISKELRQIAGSLREEGNDIAIRPELTGKESQFGDLQELIRLGQEIEGVLPCIDFAHYFARYNGRYNSYPDFYRALEELEQGLGRQALDNMHIHMSGIEHSAKGERRHLALEGSDFNYIELLRAWKDFRIRGVVISESPNIEQDAILMKRTYQRIG